MPFACLLLSVFSVPGAWAREAAVYERDVFRLVYEVEGADAVPGTDINANGIPDIVEDMATQLAAAREAFEHLGFPDPLRSPRYAGTNGIVVTVRARSGMRGLHGRAFSLANGARRFPGKWLKLQISTDTDPRRNPTPAHEYFHLVQYGQSHFMNGWYLEGMARWAEDVVRHVPVPRGETKMSDRPGGYRAANLLWHPLAADCGGPVALPPDMTEKYAYVDGTPVFVDASINGPGVMRRVLSCLHERDSRDDVLALLLGNGSRSVAASELAQECVREARRQCRP